MRIRIELGEVVCAGEVRAAAVAKSWTHCYGGAGVLGVHGAKQPVAVLTRRHGATGAFEIDGRLIDPGDFERRFPGLRAAFERLATGDGQTG